MRPRFRGVALAAAMACAALPASSQQAQPAASAVTPSPTPSPRHENPRATLRTFLDSLSLVKEGTGGETAIEDAVACLDLSALDALARRESGESLAWMLLEVLDRTWRVDYAELPARNLGPPFRHVLERNGKRYGELVISRRPNGEWLVDAATVAALPELVVQLQDVEHLEGLTGADGFDPGLALQERIPSSLRETSLVLQHWQWLGLGLLGAIGVTLERLVSGLVAFLARRRFRVQDLKVDESALSRARRPLGLLAFAGIFRLGLPWLNLPPSMHAMLAGIVGVLAAVCGVWAAYGLVDLVTGSMAQLAARSETKVDDLLVPLVRKSLKVFISVFGVVFTADAVGLNVSTLLAGIGISGIAFALAAKDTVENLFGSITVLTDRPFSIGDWVVIGDIEGDIEEVGFRSTRIRTFYNSQVTMPNSMLIRTPVDNLGARRKRRIKCSLSLTYDTPPERIEAFCEGIRELIVRHPYTRKDYYHVYLNEFSGSSLDVLLYCFVETPDWATELRERERLFLDILRLARRLGVQFAFPTRTLHLPTLPQSTPAVPSAESPADGRKPEEAAGLGRHSADAIVEEILGDRRPAPVDFSEPSRGRKLP